MIKFRTENFFYRLLWAVAAVVMAASCSSADPEDDSPLAITLTKTSVDYTASSEFVSVEASGSWTISLETSDGEAWAEINPSNGTGSKQNVILTYSGNASEYAREVKLTLSSGSRTATATMTQGAKPADVPVTPDQDTNIGEDVTTRGWLELPATLKDGREFFFHTMTVGSASVRNYSYDWSYDDLVSYWVAYPLNKELMGSGGRSNTWGLDPNLPTSLQSNISIRGFNPSSSYARGHQCPSADRLPNVAANSQTFYGTNMTPQMHVFNEGIWVNLENKVRTWANALSSKSDTLYVVTGCTVAANSTSGTFGQIGGYALDNDGKKVAIPTGYYKAVIRYQKNSTYGYGGYTGIAFYFDHTNYSRDAVEKSDAISIDELEDKIGIDLFVNLSEAAGRTNAEKIESQDPKNVGIWW